MWTRSIVLLMAFGLGCTSAPRQAVAPAPAGGPSSRESSCTIACDQDGRQVSGSVTCSPGFEAVCSCATQPNASCRPTSSGNGP